MDDELVNDLHIILKNIIENAVSESLKAKGDSKKIRISMGYKKNMIYLLVANNYSGGKKYENGEYVPTREDKKNPASGLIRASEILKKYNTNMVVMNMDTSFVAAMGIPVPCDLI